MDNFTRDRIERAKAIVSRLCDISGKFIAGYKCRRMVNEYSYEYEYDMSSCSLEADASDTLSNAIGMIEELIELWEKEAEDKKTESRALDILKRLQTEYPVYYRIVNSIEVTPSSEKIIFWFADSDDFKDPEPELLLNKKADPCITDGFITLNRIINNFDSYENVRLEKGLGVDDNGVYLKYTRKDNQLSFAFHFGDFIKALQDKEDSK